MKKFLLSLTVLATMISSPVSAGWTADVQVVHTEIVVGGIYLVTPGTAATGTGCVAGQNYIYMFFADAADASARLGDRVLSSVFYAQAANKKIKVFVQSCSGAVATANAVWVE